MSARIDRSLKLIIPVTEADGEHVRAYVYAQAISAEIFDRYFLEISKTFAAIHSEGLGPLAGPRIADKMLRRVCESLGNWDDVQKGLVAEIHRLTIYVAPGEKGWEPSPYADAKLEAEDRSEIEAALVFFTCGSAMYTRDMRPGRLGFAASLWGAQTTSQSVTEFIASLRTSNEGGNSGETHPTL
jgi:hypothetical protein